MSTRRALVAFALVMVLGALAGCGTHGEATTPAPSSAAATHTPAPSQSAVVTPFPSDPYASPETPLSPVAGTVTAVQPQGPATPTGFTFETTSAVSLTFVIGQVDDLDDFPLSDLADDVDSGAGVLVWFKRQGPDLVVYHLENAP